MKISFKFFSLCLLGLLIFSNPTLAQDPNPVNTEAETTEDLPLDQNKQNEFSKKYKDYFMNNYLLQFTKNQLPTVPEDAMVFDLAEARKAKAQAFIEANNL